MSKIVVAFSGRRGGNCDSVGLLAAGQMQAEFVRFADLKAESCGECAYECLRGGDCPKKDGVFALYDAIAAAEECMFVLPNYADFPCANFFIFAERGTGWFGGSKERLQRYMAVPKKAIVISGGEQENFRRIMEYQAEKTDVLFLSAKEFGQSSLAGRLTENEAAREMIRAFAGGE